MSLQRRFFNNTRRKLTTLLILFSMLSSLLLSGLSSLPVAQAAASGIVIGWGGNTYKQLTIPAGLSGLTAIATGNRHSLALKGDGTVVAWGDNTYGQLNIPADAQGKVTAISAAGNHNLALKRDGTVVSWGTLYIEGLTDIVAISAGYDFGLALKSDGTVVAWGSDDVGQIEVPQSLDKQVVAISAGGGQGLALKRDGTVVAWGYNSQGQGSVPAELGNQVVAISAGGFHNLALKRDGTVVAWGGNYSEQSTVPQSLGSDVVAISAGYRHSLALKRDGTVVAWGDNTYGQNNIPNGLSKVTAIAAGNFHSLALYTDTTPPTTTATTTPTSPDGTNGWFKSNVTVNLNASDFSGVKSITYSLNGGTPTTINAPSTSLNITTDGTTVVSYFATDPAGNVETAKTLTIKLDKTPPTITASAKTKDGNPYPAGTWTNQDVTVSFSCSDNLSGLNGSCPADQTFNTEGTYTASGSISDLAGNNNSATVSVKIDRVAPTVTASAKTATTNQPYPAGTWTNQNVIVSFSCSDAASGLNGSCPADQTVSTEGTTPSVSGSVSDLAGNSTSTSFGPILIDKTAPTVTATPDRIPDSNGWYNHGVTFSFNGMDNTGGSGVAGCDTSKSYSTPDSATASVSGSCKDAAGNVGSAMATFQYDATRPTVTYTGNAGTYTVDQSVNITCTATDNLSGLASTTCANISGPAYSFALSNNSFSATATDKAGNTGSGSTSFTVSVTFDSLSSLSRQFSTKADVAEGLCDKLKEAKEAAVEGDTKTKNNLLNAYRHQVAAQSGKALTTQQATILTNLSKLL